MFRSIHQLSSRLGPTNNQFKIFALLTSLDLDWFISILILDFLEGLQDSDVYIVIVLDTERVTDK